MYVSTPEIIKAFIYRTTTIIASRYTGWPKKNAPTLSVEISVITNKSLFICLIRLDNNFFISIFVFVLVYHDIWNTEM